VAAIKPLLMKKMETKTVIFGREYKNVIAEDWSKVMYSYESTFSIRASRCKVRRPEEVTT
jgi:hypothetical protein